MSNSLRNEKQTNSKELSFTGERLVQGEKILQPQRIENLARFQFFSTWIPKGEILDFGCGAGEGSHFLNKTNTYTVIGFDLSFEAVQYAKSCWTEQIPDFICGDVLSPGLKKHTFDGVISVEVIEHITKANRYLENISSLLKPDGTCMLTTPNKLLSSPKPSSLWPDHVKEYEPAELQSLCSKYFHEVVMFGEYIPVYEENLIRKLVRKLSPIVKPILPKWLRIRALPFLFSAIKSDLKLDDIKFITTDINLCPTLVAICKRPKKS